MSRNFGDSKFVTKYLKVRYGSYHNQSTDDDLDVIKKISNDHTLDELSMMKRKIDKDISLNTDTLAISLKPLGIFPIYLTITSTLFIGLVTTNINVLLSYLNLSININEKSIKQDELEGLIMSLDATPLFKVIMIVIFCLFLIILIFHFFISIRATNKTSIKYKCAYLLEESIILKEKDEIS